MPYAIKPLSCDPKQIKGMSERLIVSHYENNYGGASSDRFIDFLPVDLLGAGGTRANCDNRASRKHVSSTHNHVLLDWVHCLVLLPNPRPFVI